MPAPFTLRQLRYFVATVDHGSVAEASRRLFIAQPSISAAIKALEESFGVQLFIRGHAQGISLTPAGTRFYERAQALLRNARAFEQETLAEADVSAGRVDIGCFETFAPLFLPALIRGFNAVYPGIEIRVRDGDQDELLQGLFAGRFDLVMVYPLGLDASVETHVLTRPQSPYVLLPASHRLAGQARISLFDVYQEPLILLDVAPSRDYFVDLFKPFGLTPRVTFSSPSLELVRGMVGQGFGYSILVTRPPSSLTYDGNEVVSVEIAEDVARSSLVAAWLRRNPLTTPARRFVDYAEEAFRA
ncbi:LysR substrate-binding domain-containing protein [Caballeronia sp. Lep1P3]|uniref:LysR substrate-binding domain-containing protein n=1 Tax=Caballeronia sp. Lep1P3 TaxID=2878150 RepID=UPI001FD121DE|nr:LysR substrate-binding domain-containing protein [Caballeronia sp. Lep1P3]